MLRAAMPVEGQVIYGVLKMFEQAPVALCFLTGPQFVVSWANVQQLQLWQRSAGDALGKPLFSIFPELKSHDFEQHLAQVYQTGVAYMAKEIPAHFFRNDVFQQGWFDFTCEPLRNEAGAVEGIMAASVDVTEKIKARHTVEEVRSPSEATLKRTMESNAHYAAIVASSGNAIVSKTTDGIITTWNEGAERLFGYTAAEVIGQPITTLFPPDRLQEAREILERVLNGIPVSQYETKRLTKHGQLVDVLVSVSPVRNEKGEIIGAVKIAHDITERKKTEAALRISEAFSRGVLEASPDCIKLLDSEGRITFMNHNGLGHVEVDDFSVIKNQHWADLWADAEKKLIHDTLQTAAQGQTVNFQGRSTTAKGTAKWWDVVVSPAKNATGGLQGYVAVSRDITAQKRWRRSCGKANNGWRKPSTPPTSVPGTGTWRPAPWSSAANGPRCWATGRMK